MVNFYIDGSSAKVIESFSVWRVVDESGALMCAFYGPNSFAASVAYHKAISQSGELLKIDDLRYYDEHRWGKRRRVRENS